MVAALLLAVTIAARAQTFGNPLLGFDEQYYLLVGDRMLHGAVPFVDLFDRKPVGLFLLYAGARLLGGEGTLEYQLLAAIFALATAFMAWRFARRLAGGAGSLAAAMAYLLWLDFLGGEGGQAPIFYNLAMVAAAMVTAQLVDGRRVKVVGGALAMLLVGLAMQVKYTALFEGIFFGCALLWAAWQQRWSVPRLSVLATVWIAAALAPTVLALGVYAVRGEAHAFVFANFESMFGKLSDPPGTSVTGLLKILGILAPLLACALTAPASADPAVARRRRFTLLWLLAALAGMLVMGSFPATHYGLPVLLPAAIAASPRLDRLARHRAVLSGVLLALLIGGQFLLHAQQRAHGTASDASRLAAAADPGRAGCLYVYDGYPALYRLTNSCLPTRFAFPGHLDTANEASAAGLGVDPTQEVGRIMATRPATVVIANPPFERRNRATYAIVRAELARHYRQTFDLALGKGRHRLVFRRVE
ncbi:MAG: glycosyltransferase family 39 protein [Sphingomicrobium sp.]